MTRGYEPVTEEIGFLPGGDYDDYRPSRADRRKDQESRRKRKRRRFVVPLIALLVLALLGGGALYGGKRLTDRFGGSAQDYPGDGTGEVTIRVAPGDTATDIAATLVAEGVVASEKPFRQAAKSDPRSVSIQPGVYKLRKQMSGASALALLLDPTARLVAKFTIPEGWTLAQILPRVAKATGIKLADLQAAAKNTRALGLPAYARGRLEGFLFPATYDFDPGATATGVLKAMVAEYVKQVDDSGLAAKAAQVNLTPYEMLTVASLIERETLWDTERPKVSRVIFNRLAKDFYLGVDASVLYGLGRTTGRLTAADLKKDTPYNNRIHKGLPPTPISSPGLASLQAALQPATGPWLFYVLRPDGKSHLFTADQEEFNTAKAACVAAGKC